MSVRPEPQVDEVELLGKALCVLGRGGVEILGPDGKRAYVRSTPGRQAALEQREVAVGVAVRRDALVDLEDRHLLPRHAPVQALEHRPRRAAARHGDREPPTLGDGRRRRRRDDLCAALGDRVGVGENLDLECHSIVFSSWPPNCLRIAESRRLAKSSAPRDENLE